jgi:hypothetical protein
MNVLRIRRWLSAAAFLVLLNILGSGTAYAADPYGSLSERIIGNQISGPYEIEVVGATFVDDSAFAVTIEVDGNPPPEGTTVAFLVAPETDESRQSGFGSAAAVTEFTPEQESATVPAVVVSPGSWVLNPAPLDQEGTWKGRLLVDGPAGPATAGFTFHVYPPRPTLSPWISLGQPVIPAVVLGLALLVARTRRTPLLSSSAPAEAVTRDRP